MPVLALFGEFIDLGEIYFCSDPPEFGRSTPVPIRIFSRTEITFYSARGKIVIAGFLEFKRHFTQLAISLLDVVPSGESTSTKCSSSWTVWWSILT